MGHPTQPVGFPDLMINNTIKEITIDQPKGLVAKFACYPELLLFQIR
jgi:hypothetical protein